MLSKIHLLKWLKDVLQVGLPFLQVFKIFANYKRFLLYIKKHLIDPNSIYTVHQHQSKILLTILRLFYSLYVIERIQHKVCGRIFGSSFSKIY